MDRQFKYRGYRIESGEIESSLLSHGDISQAVVLKHDDLDELVAYIIPHEFTPTDIELTTFLSKSLPEYMIPQHFVIVNHYPLTQNGKIDSKQLMEQPLVKPITEADYVTHYSDEEIAMINIWKDVLNVSKIGLDDNFFEIGGHSLLATKLISKLKQVYRGKITLRCLFDNPSIRALLQTMQAHNSP